MIPFDTPGELYLNQLASIYQQLLVSQKSAVLYTVVTGKRTYSQMIIKSISTQSDKANENVLMVHLNMRQIFIANTQIVSVPASPGAQAFPEVTGIVTQNGRASLAAASNFNADFYALAVGKNDTNT